jgi:hypothetical protein
MSILQNSNAIGPSGYDINNSLRFRASNSAYLNRTPASAGNRKTWTWSGWVKRGKLGALQSLQGVQNGGVEDAFGFLSGDTLRFYAAGQASGLTTNAVFRDPSAWYHVVLAMDTTQATATNRTKLYVNGVQQTFSGSDYLSQNADTLFNASLVHYIGLYPNNSGYLDGYLAEVNFIDGSAKTPSDFGETDATTGVWKPKAYTGSYGTNGFYLKFSDIATTSGSNAGLGKDFSGNTNYWTTNNISVTAGTTYDAMIDSPTLTSATVANYCTLNPIRYGIASGNPAVVLSEANLKASWGADPGVLIATINIPSTGKWYWEAVVPTQTYNFLAIGVVKNQETANLNQALLTPGYAVYATSGQKWVLGTNSAYMAAPAQNTVITVAFDADTGTLYIGAGGSWANGSGSTNQTFSTAASVVTGLTGDISPAFSFNTGNFIANFGQRPFTYTPPTGYKALNTYNLPDSTIKKGNTVMDATTYTGTGSARSVVNAAGFKPDFVWMKERSSTSSHQLFDVVRGATKNLESNTTSAEGTFAQTLTSFNANGFSLGTDSAVNENTQTYVGWQWQAGQGSSSSNTSGSITSTVSVNATAGFSVVTYTGNATNNATIGHGLGVAPKMVITKNRATAGTYWYVYHSSLTATYNLYLNTTDAQQPDNVIRSTSATTFTVSSSSAANGTSMVAYCWAEIAGFSKFGSYTGNASTDGPFIYLGFRPKFIMVKSSSAVGNWFVIDSMRDSSNVATRRLFPNLSNAEDTSALVDFTANGFKLRMSSALNDSADYIYMAFAENPFKNALAR